MKVAVVTNVLGLCFFLQAAMGQPIPAPVDPPTIPGQPTAAPVDPLAPVTPTPTLPDRTIVPTLPQPGAGTVVFQEVNPLAETIFGSGLHAYSNGNFTLAKKRFQQAIRIAPNAVYYYYLAFTEGLMGDPDAFNKAFYAGVVAESENRISLSRYGTQMERIQGPRRVWLEEKRLDVLAGEPFDATTDFYSGLREAYQAYMPCVCCYPTISTIDTSATETERVIQSESTAAGLIVDFEKKSVRVNGKLIGLTPSEYLIVELLAKRAGTYVQHGELSRYAGVTESNLSWHVSNIRAKINGVEPGTAFKLINTLPGHGYSIGKP